MYTREACASGTLLLLGVGLGRGACCAVPAFALPHGASCAPTSLHFLAVAYQLLLMDGVACGTA